MKIECVELGENKTEKKYPWIGIFKTGSIVLFTSRDSGVLLRKHTIDCDLPLSDTKIGEYSTIWHEESFIPFNGIFQLSN